MVGVEEFIKERGSMTTDLVNCCFISVVFDNCMFRGMQNVNRFHYKKDIV